MTKHKHAILILAMLSLTGWSSTAFAQEPEESGDEKKDEKAARLKELNAKGRTSYKNKDYKGAIDAFQKAYELEQVPNLLYNIAKCYEKLKDWDNAIKYYNEFIVSPGIKADTRKKTLARIDEIRKIKEMQEKGTEKPKPEPKAPDHTVAYALMGTGGALVLTGVVFGVLANGQQSTFEEATDVQAKRDARSTGKTFGYVADAGYALGLISAGIGLALYLTAGEEAPTPEATSKDAAQSTWQPWLSRDGGGLQMHLRF